MAQSTAAATARYVYGVVRAGDSSNLAGTGLNREPLEVVELNGLGALTSKVPDEPLEAGREELLTHSRVLEQAFEHGVVLPMRFGVVMPSEAAVRDELLARFREELERQLDEMEGKVELNLKGIYEEQAILREVLAENPQVAKLRESVSGKPEDATYYDRIQLGEMVAEALNAKREQDEATIVERLAAHSRQSEIGPPLHERMAVNASFLVERGSIEEFDRAVEALGEEQANRIRFKYTGPLPPHSFVELSLEGE